MSLKIVPLAEMPNQINKSSVCHKTEEWPQVLEALSILAPGKGIELTLSKHSLEMIGGKDSHKHSYFAAQLRIYFKNNKIPAVAYAPRNANAICVKRIPK